MQIIKNLYVYREFLKSCIQKEIRGKYKGSFLGILWSFLNPLLMVFVYYLIFPYLFGIDDPNYLAYLITGIIPWTFFTTVIQQGVITIKSNAGIIKKVYFPREILPISVALSGLINFFISCIIILCFTIGLNVGVSYHLIFIPIIALIQAIFSLGIAFALSAINIYIKDTEYIVNFVLNILFYGTPILYTLSTFKNAPKIILQIVQINPMTQILNGYRDIFINHQFPDMSIFLLLFILSVIVFLIGFKIFKVLEKGFAEEI